MRIVQLEEPLRYDGLQLATAFVDQHAPDAADVLVLFEGEADVPVEHMVDLEDAEAGDSIYSPLMAHWIVEHRDLSLSEAVWRQRLLGRLAADWVAHRAGITVEVRGDDLYVGEGKLTVSIATRSPRSALIHFGMNVEIEGTPVPAAGLRDLRIPAREVLRAVARLYANEVASARHAVRKVRPVA